jgi:hypothetical protein
MHAVLIVPYTGEHDNGEGWMIFADKRDERQPIDFRHFEVNDYHAAVMVSEPSGGLETLGQGLARMAFLAEVSDEKTGDAWVVINDKELGRIAWQEFHGRSIISIFSISR